MELLREQFLKLVMTCDVKEVKKNFYRIKYVIDGTIESPTGRPVQVRTVWIIEDGKDIARLITAHPN